MCALYVDAEVYRRLVSEDITENAVAHLRASLPQPAPTPAPTPEAPAFRLPAMPGIPQEGDLLPPADWGSPPEPEAPSPPEPEAPSPPEPEAPGLIDRGLSFFRNALGGGQEVQPAPEQPGEAPSLIDRGLALFRGALGEENDGEGPDLVSGGISAFRDALKRQSGLEAAERGLQAVGEVMRVGGGQAGALVADVGQRFRSDRDVREPLPGMSEEDVSRAREAFRQTRQASLERSGMPADLAAEAAARAVEADFDPYAQSMREPYPGGIAAAAPSREATFIGALQRGQGPQEAWETALVSAERYAAENPVGEFAAESLSPVAWPAETARVLGASLKGAEALAGAAGLAFGGLKQIGTRGARQVVGNATRAFGISDPSRAYEFQTKVISLDALIPSHTDAMTPNPRFPAEMQPRMRDRDAARLQVEQIAERLNPDALLSDVQQLDRGSPIVGPDDLVESGNGRVLALRLARTQNPEKWQGYQERLQETASEHGITVEDLAGIKDPVLVRERTTPVDRAAFAAEANARAVLAMSPYEEALQDAGRLSDDVVNAILVGEEESIDRALAGAANLPVVRGFVASLPANERGTVVTGKGLLNARGLQRLKDVLLAKTFPDDAGRALAESFTETIDPGVKNIETGIYGSLGDMARAEGLIRSGARESGLSLAGDLAAAVNKLADLRAEGMRVGEYLSQAQLWERELSPLQEQLLTHLAAIGRSPKKVRELLKDYASLVEAEPDPRQGAMFGSIVRSKEEIVDQLITAQRQGERAELPGRPPAAPQGAAATPVGEELAGGTRPPNQPPAPVPAGAAAGGVAPTPARTPRQPPGPPVTLYTAQGDLIGRPTRVEAALDGLLVPGRAAPRPGQLLGPRGEVLSTVAPEGAVVRTAAAAEKAPTGEIDKATLARLPNLARLDVPGQVRETLIRTAQENPALIDRFRQGTITHRDLVEDLAPRLGMTAADFLKSKIGQAFNPEELLVLRANVVDQARRLAERAQEVAARGGVGALSDVERAEMMQELLDAARLQAVARGAAATAGRTLNQQKIKIDALLSRSLVGHNERLSAVKALAEARAKRAGLEKRIENAQARQAQGLLTKREAEELVRQRQEAERTRQMEAAAEARLKRAEALRGKQAEIQQERARKALEALGGKDITEEVLKQFLALQASDDPLALARFLRGMAHVSWWDRLGIIRYGSMLSATSSHMANAVGNTLQLGLAVGLKPVAVGIDVARAGITGGERTVYMAEVDPMLRGMVEGAIAGAKSGATIMRTGIDPTDAGKLDRVRPGFAVHPVVDFAAELPLRALMAADAIFRGAATAGNLRALATLQALREGLQGADRARRAQEIMENLTDFPELVEAADKAGARVVLQEDRAVSNYLLQSRRVPGLRFASEVMLPFVKVPYSIAAQGVGMTPAGFLGAMYAAKQGRTVEATEAAARAAFGTAVMGVTTSLAAAGFLTGAYPEEERERSTLPAGWQPWSFRIPQADGGATYISFQNLGPIGIPLAIAALLGNDLARGRAAPSVEYLGRVSAGVGRFMVDQTFMRGLSDAIKLVEQPARYAENFIEGMATQPIPYGALQRQLTRALDVGARDPQGAIEAVLALNPATAGQVQERRTRLGEPVRPAQTGAAAFLSPLRFDVERPDPILAEYRRLQRGGQKVGIPELGATIQGLELTPAEQRRFQQLFGETLREAVARTITKTYYQRLSPDEQAAELGATEAQARRTAADRLLSEQGTQWERQKAMERDRKQRGEVIAR